MFFSDEQTGAKFLADTGSVPNLLRSKIAQQNYPIAWANRIPYRVKLSGIGGNQTSSFLIRIEREGLKIPFIVSNNVPLNIVGMSWIERVAELKSFKDELCDPSEVIMKPSMILQAAWPAGKQTNPDVTEYQVSDRDDLTVQELEDLKEEVLNEPIAKEFDANTPGNEWMTKTEIDEIWNDFKDELTDVKKHLHGPQRLPYPCEIELKGNPKPYVAKPYPLKDSARQKAIKDLLQNLWDWHAIEKGEASWKSPLLTIMNRVTENQKRNKGYTPTYRVVQDVRQLNLYIKDVEFCCPRIPTILNSVKRRPVISVLDFT